MLHPVDTFNYMWGTVETVWERDVVNGDARSRGEFFSYALVSIVGLKGFDKAGKVGKLNKVGKGGAKVDGNTNLSSAAKVLTSNSLVPIPFNVFQTAKLKELVKHNVVSAFSKGSQWTKDFFKNDLVQKALKQGVVAINNAKTLSKIRNVVNPRAFKTFFGNTFNDVIKGPLFKTKVAIDLQFRKVLEDIKNIKVPTQFRVEQLKTSVGLGVPVFNVNVGMTSMMDVVQKIMIKKSDGTENKNKPSEKKTDGKYLSKEEFNQLNNRLVEVDEVIDEYMEIGGDYHVYDDGLIVRKYLDMTGEKFFTRYEIVDKIPNKDRTGGSKDLDSYFEGTPLAAVEYIGKPSTIAEKGVTKLVRKAAKEDYLLKVSKDIQERLAIRLGRQDKDNLDDASEKVMDTSDNLQDVSKGVTNTKYFDFDGNPIWPPNRGFDGIPTPETLKPGMLIDRYGYDGGKFLSPKDTPYTDRALAPGTDAKPYTVFEVVKPIDVQSGKIASWFGEKGGGIQYEFSKSVSDLLEEGIIRKVGK